MIVILPCRQYRPATDRCWPEGDGRLVQALNSATDPKQTLFNTTSNTFDQATNMSEDDISISLNRSEALVLFDLLSRYSKSDRLEIEDQAEQRVLWDICSSLESSLNEPLHPEYTSFLQSARDLVRDKA